MELYAGIDLRSNNSVVSVLDDRVRRALTPHFRRLRSPESAVKFVRNTHQKREGTLARLAAGRTGPDHLPRVVISSTRRRGKARSPSASGITHAAALDEHLPIGWMSYPLTRDQALSLVWWMELA